MNLQEAKQIGKVKITHHRVFEGVGAIVEHEDWAEVDTVLTRGEYLRAAGAQNLSFDNQGLSLERYDEFENANEVPYGLAVSPRGGFTVVEVWTPEGELRRGKFNFNKQAFCRRRGVNESLEKILPFLKEYHENC